MSTKTKDKPTTESLVEFVTGVPGAKVDAEAGVVRGVKILGLESQNGRSYDRSAIGKAKGLYEGAKINIDHPATPGTPRGTRDRFGVLREVNERSDGLYGDVHYLKSHPMAGPFCEAAERMPSMMGFSHNIEGKTARRDGKTIVEEITKVRSVDLVSDPATTRGLFESQQSTLREIVEGLPEDAFGRAELISIVEAGGYDDLTIGGMSGGDPESQIGNILASVFGAMLAGTGTLEAKIKQVVALATKFLTVKEPAMPETPTTGTEQVNKTESVVNITTESKNEPTGAEIFEAIKEMEAAGVKPTAIGAKALCALTADERKEYLESLKPAAPGAMPPRSGGRVTTTVTEQRKAPTSAKEFVEQLRG